VSYCRIFYCIVEYSYIHEYQTNIMQNAYYTIHYSAIFFTSVFFVVQYILQNASCIFQWNISQAVPSRCLHNLYQFYINMSYCRIFSYSWISDKHFIKCILHHALFNETFHKCYCIWKVYNTLFSYIFHKRFYVSDCTFNSSRFYQTI
jgi:hypothetical protein